MQRINLGKPYDEFIQSQIEAGYFSTATELIRDALRDKMSKVEEVRIAQIKALIDEAELSLIKDGHIEYQEDTLAKIFSHAKIKAASLKRGTSHN